MYSVVLACTNVFHSIAGKCYTWNIMYFQLLPDETNYQYHLRQRRHNLCIIVKTDDRNFHKTAVKDLY